jgi:hypothetical protein
MLDGRDSVLSVLKRGTVLFGGDDNGICSRFKFNHGDFGPASASVGRTQTTRDHDIPY